MEKKKSMRFFDGSAGKILDLFFPRRCVFCDAVLSVSEEGRCSFCRPEPKKIEICCVKCGRPVAQEQAYCDVCRNKMWSYEGGRALWLYDRTMQKSIARFKYHGRQEYGKYYARELQQAFGNWIEQIRPDALIPVPIHRNRMRSRGYNQAEVLARELGKLTGVSVVSDLLLRSVDTTPQKELGSAERHKNLNRAFTISGKMQELCRNVKCVIIIDDIYTTGSTVEACARVLKQAGISRVYFLCMCTGCASTGGK
ncbi:MAG: ComF family protein [Clostridiaceae bacterium]|nr:ComF family protein [Clostridiaceae bacterium]